MKENFIILIQGDALRIPLADESVQCVVTSPPYWGLRDYGLGDKGIGLESTPEEYVAKMIEVFREVKRVLRSDGTLWLNMGDSYFGDSPVRNSSMEQFDPDYQTVLKRSAGGNRRSAASMNGLKPKDLCGIPWRLAFALQEDGWYLRSDIIWYKPNPMPESVKSRPTKSHEYLFLLTKSSKYYYDNEAIKEPLADSTLADGRNEKGRMTTGDDTKYDMPPSSWYRNRYFPKIDHGRNKRSVWTIPTSPYKGAHFATFPPKLVEPCILAGTSAKGCCPKCGMPWVRVVEENTTFEGGSGKAGRTAEDINSTGKWSGIQYGKNIKLGPVVNTITLSWRPNCDCGLEPVPCIVLDPFAGTATVGKVCIKNQRSFVGIELSEKYLNLSKKRLHGSQIGMII